MTLRKHLISLTMAFLLPSASLSFESEHHNDITTEAARNISSESQHEFLTSFELQIIDDASRMADRHGLLSNRLLIFFERRFALGYGEEWHCDNNAIKECLTKVSKNINIALKVGSCSKNAGLEWLSFALHGMQDFYSHSSAVELEKYLAISVSNILDEAYIENIEVQDGNACPIDKSHLSTVQDVGITSGYFSIVNPWWAVEGMCRHGLRWNGFTYVSGIAKDDTSIVDQSEEEKFKAAKLAAIKSTESILRYMKEKNVFTGDIDCNAVSPPSPPGFFNVMLSFLGIVNSAHAQNAAPYSAVYGIPVIMDFLHCEGGLADACLSAEQGDFSSALEKFQDEYRRKTFGAANNIGVLYELGYANLAQSDKDAADYYRVDAEIGLPIAKYNYATVKTVIGVTLNEEQNSLIKITLQKHSDWRLYTDYFSGTEYGDRALDEIFRFSPVDIEPLY